MSDNTWRDKAAPIIRDVILRVGRKDDKRLRAELRKAYPFGERALWPYKVWLSEIKKQLGAKPRSDSPQVDWVGK